MQTRHRLHHHDARGLADVLDEPVHLVLTSPPYPMIEMWDEAFRAMSMEARRCLDETDATGAFEAMHRELDKVWAAAVAALVPGGICCINIGDATRTMAGQFRIHPNHVRIVTAMQQLAMTVLPDILWRKPTNGPTKFMGSGMLPPGAYVTYEHEYILVFRKGGKRLFKSTEDKTQRRRSAYFWEERNVWFSDLWSDLRGIGQARSGGGRSRSAAFPVELAWRLIHMFSLQGDTVLDPFAGTGTTALAAAWTGRHSVGCDLDPALLTEASDRLASSVLDGQSRALARLAAHRRFAEGRAAQGKPPKHHNAVHDVPVVTGQERELRVLAPRRIVRAAGELVADMEIAGGAARTQ